MSHSLSVTVAPIWNSRSWTQRWAMIGACLLAWGCGNEGDEHAGAPPPGSSADGGAGGALPVGREGECEGDLAQDCTIYLRQGSGVTSCYRGSQRCEDGYWTDCVSL